jgi:hypothetical protein
LVGISVQVAVGLGGLICGVRVEVGRAVTLDVGGLVGMREAVADGIGLGEDVKVGRALEVGAGNLVCVGCGLGVKVIVTDGRGKGVGAAVLVGGAPVRVNLPDAFQPVPMYTWTSYSPDSHSAASRIQLATPIPEENLLHDSVSTCFN